MEKRKVAKVKTKEIEVMIQDVALGLFEKENTHDLVAFRSEPSGRVGKFLKCKIIIPVSEKKIEITESDFNDAAKTAMTENLYWPHVVNGIRQILFGEKND